MPYKFFGVNLNAEQTSTECWGGLGTHDDFEACIAALPEHFSDPEKVGYWKDVLDDNGSVTLLIVKQSFEDFNISDVAYSRIVTVRRDAINVSPGMPA